MVSFNYGIAAVAATAINVSAHKLKGVAPQDATRYSPIVEKDGRLSFKCHDHSKEIDWKAVNDDYCDCPDGSDEPGTSACAKSTFYCANEGHIPSRIRSSRVNDGICDPECCDGSDESDGKVECPNTCAKVGKEYRKKMAELENIRRAGGKIREKYISDGRKGKENVENEIARLEVELEVATEKEARLKKALELAETMEKAVIEAKIKTPLYGTLTFHQEAIKSLLTRNTNLKEELKMLTLMLDDLARGYNPNYQDMTVKGAVVAYKEWRGSQEKGEADQANGLEDENAKLKELLDEGEWDAQKLTELTRQSVLELMDSGLGGASDKMVASDSDSGLLFRIHEYLPDALVPYFEAMVDTLLDVLIKANVIKDVKRMRPRDASEGLEPENVTAARKAHTEASNHLRKIQNDLSSRQTKLGQFESKYGREMEFKALEGKCIQKDLGEYMYEYCFFGKAKQIPNKAGAQVTLGNFANWNPKGDANETDDGFWLQQIYANGQKCWNGPQRSAIVDLVCNTSNQLLDVFEAEKCIYSMKVSTPAVCFPPRTTPASTADAAAEATVKDEL